MNQEEEERKEVPVAAPTTGESLPDADEQRLQHIDELKKLKLVRAVKLGLSVARAARIAKLAKPSAAHLVLQNYEQSKRARLDE